MPLSNQPWPNQGWQRKRQRFQLNGGAGVRIQFVQIGQQGCQAVVDVDADGSQFIAEFFKTGAKNTLTACPKIIGSDTFIMVAFILQREQYAFCFCVFYLLGKEGEQGFCSLRLRR